MGIRAIASLAALAALLTASTADARPVDPERFRALANKVWHHPCGGTWTMTVTDDLPPGMFGRSTPTECRIEVARWITDDRETVCHTVLHEVGHFRFGLGHSLNPRSVMYAEPGRIDRRCRAPKATKRKTRR